MINVLYVSGENLSVNRIAKIFERRKDINLIVAKDKTEAKKNIDKMKIRIALVDCCINRNCQDFAKHDGTDFARDLRVFGLKTAVIFDNANTCSSADLLCFSKLNMDKLEKDLLAWIFGHARMLGLG